MVRSLRIPPEQFDISNMRAVLNLMDARMEVAVARYGQGNFRMKFRWVAMAGDLSQSYV